MDSLQALISDGFLLPEQPGPLEDVAALSLRTALRSYFATYQAIRPQLQTVLDKPDAEQKYRVYTHDYYERVTETVLHLQHFFELICKSVLRRHHPLLADQGSTNPVVLYRLLTGETLSPEEQAQIKSLEFSESFERLEKLVKAQIVTDADAQILVNNAQCLKLINQLRNRLWHRGAFVLRYRSFDLLVSRHVIPVIRGLLALPAHADCASIASSTPLHCGLEVMAAIEAEASIAQPDLTKIAFLKELGRAAYQNPLHVGRFADYLNKNVIGRAERAAAAEREAFAVRQCPVCGLRSLIVFDEVYHPEEGHSGERPVQLTIAVQCYCCSLDLHRDTKNASAYGLPGIEDYWTEQEL